MKDKYGIEIEPGDVLKVFHFVGARRKKHYMYKLAVSWNGKLYGAHLISNTPTTPAYPLWTGTENSQDYEIVQSRNFNKLK